jgi:VIT1/CCC1 family predicted Fe2+/Mn2+ transporter
MVLCMYMQKMKDYIDEAVYGANDGIITTFAVVSGASGAMLGSDVIVILGLANLIADGFSMGTSSFLAIRTEASLQKFAVWKRKTHATSRSFVTFLAFVLAGSIPLLPFLYSVGDEAVFMVSSASAGLAFFIVGGSRAFVTKQSFLYSGLEMLFVGGVASSIAYGIGFAVEHMVV